MILERYLVKKRMICAQTTKFLKKRLEGEMLAPHKFFEASNYESQFRISITSMKNREPRLFMNLFARYEEAIL